MIDYGTFHFAAPPCTEAGWFLKAAQLAGFGPGFRHHAYTPYPTRRDYSRLRVSLVRHPCDWLAACHGRIAAGQLHTNHLGRFGSLDASSLFAFIRSYLDEIPGGVGQLYARYEADVRIRIEDMPWAFVELMQSLEVADSLVESTKRLSPPDRPASLKWDKSLRSIIMEKEKEVCDVYDYW